MQRSANDMRCCHASLPPYTLGTPPCAPQAAAIAPKVNALLHTTVSLLMLTLVALVAAVLAYRKYVQRGGGMLVVRKDGRV